MALPENNSIYYRKEICENILIKFDKFGRTFTLTTKIYNDIFEGVIARQNIKISSSVEGYSNTSFDLGVMSLTPKDLRRLAYDIDKEIKKAKEKLKEIEA